MAFRDTIQWVFRVAVRILVLIAVAFLSMLLAIRFTIHGREVKVPDLAHLRAGDAQVQLEQLGLGIRIEDRVYTDAPAETVVRQIPRAGESVRRGQRVHVVISLGAQSLPVPDVVGKTGRTARIGILQGGMQLGHVSSAHLEGMDADVVIVQDPGSGLKSTHSSHVDLLVSLGTPETGYLMPDLTGSLPSEAQRRLASAGLRIGKYSTVVTAPEKRGLVVGQSVPRGSRVVSGTPVDVQLGG
jgi:eukaryotic-like serine/threonine-protein kinase